MKVKTLNFTVDFSEEAEEPSEEMIQLEALVLDIVQRLNEEPAYKNASWSIQMYTSKNRREREKAGWKCSCETCGTEIVAGKNRRFCNACLKERNIEKKKQYARKKRQELKEEKS